MSSSHSPTVRLRRLARELRKLREDSGLTPEAAAAQLGWSRSKVSRIETGRTMASRSDVGAVCDLYGINSADRAGLIQLASEVRQRGWWTAYADVFTGSYIGLEDEAALIRQWEVQLIPGLLQTEDYARTVISLHRPQAEVQRRVMARMARRTLLSRPDAPQLRAILDEAAIRRPIGGDQVMHEQLEALLIAARRANIEIRVLPFSAGEHAGLEGAFTILSFSEEIDPDVAYVEGTAGDIYVESSDQVDRCKLIYERILDAALSAEDSLGLISTVKDKLGP
ncbi:helix-turn-helix domain-containing protein [Nonomuraea basaltis]|uniref:helix-turn-helix domain-containing protein n=1 Tax=Nonomuraea basaltis TaxID=2495887 RepID=UPI00110C6CB2|nr:helix-turn-helix transcriptional regulator [Nonomuraea basaltis]TMR97998.1 helix-turn-helix domain-containing protein [Nonomuraea basaltis]